MVFRFDFNFYILTLEQHLCIISFLNDIQPISSYFELYSSPTPEQVTADLELYQEPVNYPSFQVWGAFELSEELSMQKTFIRQEFLTTLDEQFNKSLPGFVMVHRCNHLDDPSEPCVDYERMEWRGVV